MERVAKAARTRGKLNAFPLHALRRVNAQHCCSSPLITALFRRRRIHAANRSSFLAFSFFWLVLLRRVVKARLVQGTRFMPAFISQRKLLLCPSPSLPLSLILSSTRTSALSPSLSLARPPALLLLRCVRYRDLSINPVDVRIVSLSAVTYRCYWLVRPESRVLDTFSDGIEVSTIVLSTQTRYYVFPLIFIFFLFTDCFLSLRGTARRADPKGHILLHGFVSTTVQLLSLMYSWFIHIITIPITIININTTTIRLLS